MAKRFAWIAFLVTVILIMGMPAAFAAPGHGSAVAAAHKKSGATHGAKALENASKGMNRPGSAGQWKEHGHVPSVNSAPQGHAVSDPDWNGNGGIDKPGQTGGFNDDRDGNNGCGNDSDREDDNNGWCGHKPTPSTPPSQPPVVGPTITPPNVLGSGPVTRGATLPRTGADVADLFITGSSMLVIGAAMRRKQKRAR